MVRQSLLVLAGAALSCFASVASAASIDIAGCDSLTVSGGNGTSALTITCATGAPPTTTGAPSLCSLSPGSGSVGSPISFTASCRGGSPVDTYLWSVTPATAAAVVPSTASGAQTITFSAAATLTMTPMAAGVAGSAQSAFITAGGGGGVFAGTCPGFSKTLVQSMDWNAAGNMIVNTSTVGGIGSNGVLVASFTTPFTPGYDGALVNVGVAEFPGDQSLVARTIAISEGAPMCSLAAGSGFTKVVTSTGSMYLSYGVSNPYGYGMLKPGTTYYVVVANKGRGGSNSCTTGRCDFRLEIGKPPGI